MAASNIHEAIENNNRGASLIESDNIVQGVPYLTTALKIARNCMDEGPDAKDDDMVMGNPHETPFDFNQIMTSHYAAFDATSDNEGYIVYKHPIHIPQTRSPGLISTSQKATISAISVFNLALAHHMTALTSSDSKMTEQYLKKAGKLYDFSLKVLGVFEAESYRTAETLPHSFFYLATLNNLAHVHKGLNNLKASVKCCEDVIQILAHLANSQKSLTEDTLQIFYQNSFFFLLSSRGMNAAPAA